LESYLEAIEQLRSNIKFFSSKKGFKSSDGVLNNANNLLAKAISKLEDEFKQLLSSYRFVFSCSLVFLHCVSGSSAQVL
jgi:exocyst complex protein 7